MERDLGRLLLKPAVPSRYDIGAAPKTTYLSAVTTTWTVMRVLVVLIFATPVVYVVMLLFFPHHPLTQSADVWLMNFRIYMERGMIAAVGALAVGFVFSVWIAYRKKLKAQIARDAVPVASGPFVLLLRPFHTDARVKMSHPFLADDNMDSVLDVGRGMRPPEYVARVLERYIDVLQIGGNREDIAASRLFTSDDTWQAVLATQAAEASAIVIMPLVTKTFGERKTRGTSTIWELEHLHASGALAKTALLLPPWESFEGIQLSFYVRGRLKNEWRQVQDTAAKFGLDLPAYSGDSDVLLFSQASNGRWTAYSAHTDAETDLARNLLDAIDGLTMRSGVDLALPRQTATICSSASPS